MKNVKRVVCVFLACCIIAVASTPRTRAVDLVLTPAIIVAALVAFLGASGIYYAAQNGSVTDVAGAIQGQLDDWIGTNYGSWDGLIKYLNDQAAYTGILPITCVLGKLYFSSYLSNIFNDIRNWLIGDKFQGASGSYDVVASTGGDNLTAYVGGVNIGTLSIGSMQFNGAGRYSFPLDNIILIEMAIFSVGTVITFDNMTAKIERTDNKTVKLKAADGVILRTDSSWASLDNSLYFVIGFAYDASDNLKVYYGEKSSNDADGVDLYVAGVISAADLGLVASEDDTFQLTSTYDSTVPAITVPQNGDSIAIDVGTGLTGTLDDILQLIMQGVTAGEDTSYIAKDVASPITITPPAYASPGEYTLDLTSFFPFCIPFDLFRAIQLFRADPVTPSITWNPVVAGHTYSLEIDLHQWDGVAAVLRKMELFAFIVGLAVETRKLIKW